MTALYIDTSAWVKQYYDERGSSRVRELMAGEFLLACSVLGLVEVFATFARKRKAGEIETAEFLATLERIEADWAQFVQFQLSGRMLEDAKFAAARFALRGADAVHFAALRRLVDSAAVSGDVVILVTSDRELKSAAVSVGIEVIDPEVESAIG